MWSNVEPILGSFPFYNIHGNCLWLSLDDLLKKGEICMPNESIPLDSSEWLTVFPSSSVHLIFGVAGTEPLTWQLFRDLKLLLNSPHGFLLDLVDLQVHLVAPFQQRFPEALSFSNNSSNCVVTIFASFYNVRTHRMRTNSQSLAVSVVASYEIVSFFFYRVCLYV